MTELRNLGFGKTMEKKLHSVGIHSAEELRELGSKQAVFRLKEQYPNTCVVILYYLEAAIRGVEMKQLDEACKSELKTYFKKLEGDALPVLPVKSGRRNDEASWFEPDHETE